MEPAQAGSLVGVAVLTMYNRNRPDDPTLPADLRTLYKRFVGPGEWTNDVNAHVRFLFGRGESAERPSVVVRAGLLLDIFAEPSTGKADPAALAFVTQRSALGVIMNFVESNAAEIPELAPFLAGLWEKYYRTAFRPYAESPTRWMTAMWNMADTARFHEPWITSRRVRALLANDDSADHPGVFLEPLQSGLSYALMALTIRGLPAAIMDVLRAHGATLDTRGALVAAYNYYLDIPPPPGGFDGNAHLDAMFVLLWGDSDERPGDLWARLGSLAHGQQLGQVFPDITNLFLYLFDDRGEERVPLDPRDPFLRLWHNDHDVEFHHPLAREPPSFLGRTNPPSQYKFFPRWEDLDEQYPDERDPDAEGGNAQQRSLLHAHRAFRRYMLFASGHSAQARAFAEKLVQLAYEGLAEGDKGIWYNFAVADAIAAASSNNAPPVALLLSLYAFPPIVLDEILRVATAANAGDVVAAVERERDEQERARRRRLGAAAALAANATGANRCGRCGGRRSAP